MRLRRNHALASRAPAVLSIALLTVAQGCMLDDIHKDKKVLESYRLIEGTVEVTDWNGAPLVLGWSRLHADDNILVVDTRVLAEPQDFRLHLEPGPWLVGAFEDTNRNLRHDEGERGVVSEPIDLLDGGRTGVLLTVSEVFDRSRFADYVPIREHRFAVGDVVPLSDPRFSDEPSTKGLWQPITYALENRPGVYLLEPHVPGRTPVLFVHGMSGYAQEFESLIGRLDRSRFEPWVFSYPSGFSLEPVAQFLHSAILELETEHDIENLCVVAHSMGGLVSRRFLGFHLAGARDTSVRSLVTLSSPLDGVPSAGLGIRFAPSVLVVPAWIDIAPESDYLKSLYTPALPPEVEYHLLFGYEKAGASDGVVSLSSQLRDEAQAEADVVRGFRVGHTEILTDDAAAAQVLAALDRCRGDVGAPRVAPRPLD